MSKLREEILGDFRAYVAIKELRQELSSKAPVTPHEVEEMFKSLMHKKWLALMYVCNDLMILPDDMQLEPSVCPDEITKKVMVTALVRWVSRV